MVGTVDPEDGSWSGDDMAYIYPDFKNAIRGTFKDELLVKGQMCNLTGKNGHFVELNKHFKIAVYSSELFI